MLNYKSNTFFSLWAQLSVDILNSFISYLNPVALQLRKLISAVDIMSLLETLFASNLAFGRLMNFCGSLWGLNLKME